MGKSNALDPYQPYLNKLAVTGGGACGLLGSCVTYQYTMSGI